MRFFYTLRERLCDTCHINRRPRIQQYDIPRRPRLIIQYRSQHLRRLSGVMRLYCFNGSRFHVEIFRPDGIFQDLAVPEFTYQRLASYRNLIQPTLVASAAMNHHHMTAAQAMQNACDDAHEIGMEYAQQLIFLLRRDWSAAREY